MSKSGGKEQEEGVLCRSEACRPVPGLAGQGYQGSPGLAGIQTVLAAGAGRREGDY